MKHTVFLDVIIWVQIVTVVAVGLTAAGAGLTCTFHGDAGSLQVDIDCPNQIEEQFKKLDISRWKEIGDHGKGSQRIYGQYAVFSAQILVALLIGGLMVVRTANRHPIERAVGRNSIYPTIIS